MRDWHAASDRAIGRAQRRDAVKTKGTPVTGRRRDKPERIAETVADLELACEGAFSLARRSPRGSRQRWGAALARACSVFLRKKVVGDRNDPATRLLDDRVIQTFGVGFAKLRPIQPVRRILEVGMSTFGGMIVLQKLDEVTGSPEAAVPLPVAAQELSITIEWPLPGTASWTDPPTGDRPYTGSDDPFAEIDVPPGEASPTWSRSRERKEIGDGINKVISRLADASDANQHLLKGVIDQADFNDESKLGKGKEMQERLSKLVGIFEGLDSRANRAHGDDLLGDAYEYLMRPVTGR